MTSERLWITRLMFWRRTASGPNTLRAVAGGRLEAAERLPARARCRAALGAGADEDGQVVAGVAVERREHLVEVDVGQRLADRDVAAVLQAARAGRARLELGDHVLEAGLRAQQHRRVLVDAAVAGAPSAA